MTSPDLTPDKAIEVLEEGQGGLTQLVDVIPKDALDKQAGIGDWSIKDMIGHVATWEELAVLTFGEWSARKPLTVQNIIGTHGGVDEFNAVEVEKHRQSTAEEVLERAEKVHSELVDKIGSTDLETWKEPQYFESKRPPKTLGGTIGAITGGKLRGDFAHVFDHLSELRSFVESLSDQKSS